VIALYRDGTSAVHRLPAGVKIAALMVFALAISVGVSGLVTLAVASAVVVLCYLLAGLGVAELGRQLVAVRWIVLVMAVMQLLLLPVTDALVNTGRVVIVVVLAALVSLTTRTGDMLDAMERMLGPLRRFGVNPAKVGLLLSLTITTIPVIAGFATSIRDAQRARGVPPRPTRLAVPLLVASLRHADDLADSLAARGVE
jgi:biotin transport system permease protein